MRNMCGFFKIFGSTVMIKTAKQKSESVQYHIKIIIDIFEKVTDRRW